MKRYYICDTGSRSGIARYAEDFHRLVLSPLSYEHIAIEDLNSSKLQTIYSNASFHIEVGADRYLERGVLLKLLRLGCREVDITLHDPPFITFPSVPFSNPWLASLSRGIDWYFGAFGLNRSILSKCRNIFVLSRKGKELVENQYSLRSVHYIPHVVDLTLQSDSNQSSDSKDLLFYGFIGPRKGLEYTLMMHSELIKSMPDIHLHVVGEGTSRTAIAYLEDLKARFHQGVTYHGYVPESNLDNIFAKVGHVVLPFKPYKYTCSVSGSILGALRRRKIVWTTPVNAIPDLIQDGKNGLYLTMQLQADVGRFLSLLGDRSMSAHLRDGIVKTLSSHSADHIVDTLKGVL